MTKKRTLTLAASIVLALTLALTMALPTFARDYSESTTPGVNAEAVLTKLFKMPANTVTPAATFSFTFTPKGVDGGNDTTGMPTLTTKVTYNGGEAATVPETDVKIVAKQSGDFLADIATDNDWPGEGVYTYILSEDEGGIDITDASKEGEDYSQARYEIEFWVKEYGTGNYYVQYVNAKTVDGFVDEYYEGTPGGEKVDPTPDGMNQIPGITIEDDFSQVFFTNKYWMTNGGGTDNPETAALELTKIIKGNGANLDAYFAFDITLIQPSVIPASEGTMIYKAYVMDAAGNIVKDTAGKNGTISGTDDNGDYFLFTSNIEKVGIKLTNKQTLAFVDLHVGAVVKMYEQEQSPKEYQPRYQLTGPSGNVENIGTVGERYGFPRTGDNGPHYLPDGTNNVVTFTNVRSGATPGGISVDNLPYFALIAVGLIALAGFAVVKARKRAANNA